MTMSMTMTVGELREREKALIPMRDTHPKGMNEPGGDGPNPNPPETTGHPDSDTVRLVGGLEVR